MLTSVGGTSNIFNAGLMTLGDWAWAVSGMLASRRSFFNVVVVVGVSFVWMERLDVLWGFYTVLVVGTIVGPTQTRGFVSHWQPTILRIEAVPGCCVWPEGENARGAFSFFSSSSSSDSKNVSRFLGLFGNRALATRTAVLTFLLDKAFLARLLISFLITCSALRLTLRANPAFKPLSVLLGAFNGFRGSFKPSETPAGHLQHQPFAILVVFVGSKPRQTASEHTDKSLHSVH